jgi:hypothetical protein
MSATQPANLEPNLWISATRDGFAAAKQNRWAAICLWAFGTALLIGYLWVPPIQRLLAHLGEWKQHSGLAFSILSTALFGGLLPSLLPRWLNRRGEIPPPRDVLANTLFWGAKGIELDWLYRVQALLFGTEPGLTTVAVKTLVDQALYVPTIGLVNVVVFRLWQTRHYAWRGTLAEFRAGWYRRHVLPVLISNWLVWIPAVALIYRLPLPLQLPIQNLVLCFWVLILTILTRPAAPNSNSNSTREEPGLPTANEPINPTPSADV